MCLETTKKLNGTNDIKTDMVQPGIGGLSSKWRKKGPREVLFFWQAVVRGLSKLDYDSAGNGITYFLLEHLSDNFPGVIIVTQE